LDVHLFLYKSCHLLVFSLAHLTFSTVQIFQGIVVFKGAYFAVKFTFWILFHSTLPYLKRGLRWSCLKLRLQHGILLPNLSSSFSPLPLLLPLFIPYMLLNNENIIKVVTIILCHLHSTLEARIVNGINVITFPALPQSHRINNIVRLQRNLSVHFLGLLQGLFIFYNIVFSQTDQKLGRIIFIFKPFLVA
jgi:hypothetical protein